MAGSTIGQAYVQILPSMNGMSAAINQGGGGMATSSGTVLGGKLGTSMVAAAGKILAAAGLGKLLTSSITEGGKLQQSLGGVETLFGSSADKVKKNASKAWKNVGMSANEYMENSTSFAASLVSSVGGNTSKAADLADVAMRDMSDNANKMGTDLGSITYAYQGFAKENYTMLDNLKLGYGGTKSEMQRLISDASKMTGVQDKLGVSVDGTSMSYDNIIKAIHVVQANMGVMGTTSKEAATTLTGSAGMMKSAWSDLIGQMSLGGDLTEPLQNLVSSVGTFASNLIPMVRNVFSSVGTIIASTDWGSMLSGISAGLSSFTQIGAEMIEKIADGVSKSIPNLLSKALPMLVDFSENLRENAGTLVDSGLDLVINIADGLIDSLPVLIENIPTIVTNIAGIINDNAPKLIITGGTIILKLAAGIVKSIPVLVKNLPKIIKAIVAVFTAFNWMNLGKKVLTGISNGIKALPSKLSGIGKSAVSKLKSILSSGGRGAANALKSGISKIPSTVKSIFSKAWSIIKGVVSKFKNAFKFSWSLPHLKVPHVSVSGGKAPYGIGGKGSLPHFSVSWAAKGGILDGASLIGAGEAGKEALLPLERNTGWMDTLADRVGKKETAVTFNVTVNGADNPDDWARRLADQFKRQVKMA